MIKVSQKCETLEEGIKFMMAGAKADYVAMSTSYGKKELTGYSLEPVSYTHLTLPTICSV